MDPDEKQIRFVQLLTMICVRLMTLLLRNINGSLPGDIQILFDKYGNRYKNIDYNLQPIFIQGTLSINNMYRERFQRTSQNAKQTMGLRTNFKIW